MNKSLPFVVGIIFAIVAYAAWRAYTLITFPVIQALCVWVMIFATGVGMMLLAAGVFNVFNKDND